MSLAKHQRVALATAALRDFMDSELAASKIELEAKLIESQTSRPEFEPAHLHEARVHLQRNGEIDVVFEATRGKSAPSLFVTTNTARRTRRVHDAASRKRLLMSRYYGYTVGAPSAKEGLAGPAERGHSTRRSCAAASARGLRSSQGTAPKCITCVAGRYRSDHSTTPLY